MGVGKPRIEVVMLGTGTSHGVPMIGCECAVCGSDDPKDHRSRPSIFVRYGEVNILVDASPELRLQCLDNRIKRVDAVLFTHHHADHVLGLDDLRRFNWLQHGPVDVYATEQTFEALNKMFPYAFQPQASGSTSRPELNCTTISTEPFTIGGRRIIPIPLMHDSMPVLGFRFGRFAYCTDCSAIPESSRPLLTNLDVFVLDAVRRKPHPAHFNLARAIEMAGVIGARQTYFTHIAHGLSHAQTSAELPEGIALAYDGLRFVVD
jgi:phosphoribosyl 1,2-cyclic phosphate phosphodiesterase